MTNEKKISEKNVTVEDQKTAKSGSADKFDSSTKVEAESVILKAKPAVEEEALHAGSVEKKVTSPASGKITPYIFIALVAIPLAGIAAYIFMPDEFNSLLTSVSDSVLSSDDEHVNNESQSQVPAAVPNSISSRQLASNAYQSNPSAYNNSGSNNSSFNEPDWVAQQRNEMDKRRLEFEKRSAENYPQNWPAQTPAEPPQWVKERQAEMQQEMIKYQQKMQEFQLEMNKYQQESAKQHQQWLAQVANSQYNNAQAQPGYMNRPNIHPYQQAFNGADIQPQAQLNQKPDNSYSQHNRQSYNSYNQQRPPQVYYNRQPYGYGPYNAPSGWNGRAYR